MEPEVSFVMLNFHRRLKRILGNKVKDIVIHGSAVNNSFVRGKGDIDFLVLLSQDVSDVEYEEITDYHRKSRLNKNLESQLEGSYIVLSKCHNNIDGGIYIGSTESRWKRFAGNSFSNLDKAYIRAINYSLYNEKYIEKLFNYRWEDVKSEIRVNTEKTLALLEKLPDFDFKLYALHTAVRGFYTYKTHTFASKLQALEMMENDLEFIEHRDFIRNIKVYKSMLSEAEKFDMNKLDLSRINEIVFDIHKLLINDVARIK